MSLQLQIVSLSPFRRITAILHRLTPKTPLVTAAVMGLVLSGCASEPGPGSVSMPDNIRVNELQVVDCLLPGLVRQIGNTSYVTQRQPTRTTVADCSLRGGEYTAYDRGTYETSLAVWMPEAKAGDADAQANVGEIYERGLGGDPNYQAAALWYEKAARQGNTRAQFNLGTLYEQGKGVEQDKLAALNWYRKAWGIPEDSVVYQSLATAETRELQAQLQRSIEERDARISKLERDLKRLQTQQQEQQNTPTAAAVTGESTEAVNAQMAREIEDLRLWIDALEAERNESYQQLAALPKYRDPEERAAALAATPARAVRAGDIDFGRYYALVIGNQKYTNIEDLDTPQNDAVEMAELLRDKYGFSVEVLLDATNVQVMETINDLNNKLGEDDNLLIYYAGHGARIKTGKLESGYWLPVNADAPPRNTFWVSNEFVTGHLSRLKARRVMVVADSCYAGLLSEAPSYLMLKGAPQYTDELLRYKLPKRSRLLLASGGDRPVLDNGASGHSVFAAALLEVLRDNDQVLSGPQLYAAIDDRVKERSRASGFNQQAEYKVIKGAGHEVGDFFFVPI